MATGLQDPGQPHFMLLQTYNTPSQFFIFRCTIGRGDTFSVKFAEVPRRCEQSGQATRGKAKLQPAMLTAFPVDQGACRQHLRALNSRRRQDLLPDNVERRHFDDDIAAAHRHFMDRQGVGCLPPGGTGGDNKGKNCEQLLFHGFSYMTTAVVIIIALITMIVNLEKRIA